MPDQYSDFIVIYGGRLEGNALRVNQDVADRCDEALWWAKKLPNPVLVFTVDHKIKHLRNATIDYLLQRGWCREKILSPEKASDTWGETKAAIQILTHHGASEAIIISSWYHIWRIWLMWRYLGFEGRLHFIASPGITQAWFVFPWETAGHLKFLGRKWLYATSKFAGVLRTRTNKAPSSS